MSNELSPELLAQIFSQESNDPYLTLATFSHPSFAEDFTIVNNTEDIVSRGITFSAFPFKMRLPVDDGETVRTFALEMDNVSLDFLKQIRSVISPISVKLEMILASMPDEVQVSQEDLEIQSTTYNDSKISANLILDNFLNTELSSERYGPTNFPGIFG